MRTSSLVAGDGFPLAAQTSGRDDAPALLLLSGQANSHRWWTALRDGVEDRFRVVTVDYRGTGDSRGPVGDWSTATFAADAAHVLGALGAAPAAVYGTSMGGRVAQVLAADHPAAVDRLVLAGTSPGGPFARERDTAVRRALADPDADARRRALHRLFYTDAWPGRPEDSHLLGDPTMTPSSPNRSDRYRRSFFAAYRAADAWPVYFGPHASHNEPGVRVLRGAAAQTARVEAGTWRLPLAERPFGSLFELQEGADGGTAAATTGYATLTRPAD